MKQRKIDDKIRNTAWYAKLGYWFADIPWYGYAFAVLIFLSQHCFYMAAEAIGRNMGHIYGWGPFGDPSIWDPTVEGHWYWLGWTPKTAIDNMFPLILEFWMIPYVSFSSFITFGALVAAHSGREKFTEFVITSYSCWFIGFLIMAFAPAYMHRGAEGVLDRCRIDDFWSRLYGSLFSLHNFENINLAPSFHCLSTGLIMASCYNKKGINRGLHLFTLVWAILIYFSTCYTKHHYFMDFVIAMAVLAVVYIPISRLHIGQKIWNKHPVGARIADKTIPDIYKAIKNRKAAK